MNKCVRYDNVQILKVGKRVKLNASIMYTLNGNRPCSLLHFIQFYPPKKLAKTRKIKYRFVICFSRFVIRRFNIFHMK